MVLTRKDTNKRLGITIPRSYRTDFNPGLLRLELLRLILRNVKVYMGSLAGKKIAFIGGGIGREIVHLKEKNDFFAVNMDINLKLLGTGMLYYKNANLQCAVVAGDGMRLPFKDDAFDIVVLYESLHHMDELITCLSESFRIGKTLFIADRRKCFVSKLGRSLKLIKPEEDGFFANELDLGWFGGWINTLPGTRVKHIKRHFLYLLVINKPIHDFIIKSRLLCRLDIVCVRLFNALFGYFGNGVIIAAGKKPYI